MFPNELTTSLREEQDVVPQPQHLRVFLASPGDVADERSLALKVLERLSYDPLLRGKITLEVVA